MTHPAGLMGASKRAVRDELQDLLGPLLGVYRKPDGTTIPAFWMAPPRVPPEWRVEGIEAVLTATPTLDRRGQFGAIATMRTWSLKVVQYDTAQTLEAVELLLYRAYPHSRRRPMAQTDDTYEQLTVELLDPILITPL